jgi:hypothetical protein
MGAAARAFSRLRGVVIQRDLAADDGLHPCPRRIGGKFQRAKHVVGIGHGHGGHFVLDAQIYQ